MSSVALTGYTCMGFSLALLAAGGVECVLTGGPSEVFRPATTLALLALGNSLLGTRDSRSKSHAKHAWMLSGASALFTIGADLALWSVGVKGGVVATSGLLTCGILVLRASVLTRQASE